MAGEVPADILDSLAFKSKIVQNINFMKKLLFHAFLITLLSLTTSFEGSTCTTFCINTSKDLVLGKNLDFFTGVGQVVINKRNVKKLSFISPPEKPFQWTSKYGSITFNQMGREFPYGGINEKGLVIEEMWLAETNYPEMDERYGLFELQWIQYQLDNAATVEEVLASDATVRIIKTSVPLHFIVCDANGNMATIEYLDGKMIYHTKSRLPISALTNDTYNQSTGYVSSLANLEEHCTNSFTSGSFDRFAKAALMVKRFNGQNAIDYSFDILGAVSQGELTQWSIVYDIKNRAVHFKTQNNPKTRILHLTDFDFSCHSQSLYIDIDENRMNNKLCFLPYSYQKNRETINTAFDTLVGKAEFKDLVPNSEVRELIARYPESTACAE